MKKEIIRISMAISLLCGVSTIPVQAGWLDTLQTVSASMGNHRNSLTKLKSNDVLGIGEMTQIYPPIYGNMSSSVYQTETASGNPFLIQCKGNYLVFTSVDGNTTYYTTEKPEFTAGRFQIREVQVSDPDTRLWMIVYDGNGNSGTHHGFWLVGTRGNMLQIYITPSKMKTLGMPLPDTGNWATAKGGHRLNFHAINHMLHMEYTFEFWPPDVSHAEAWRILDKTADIAWDEKKQAFTFAHIRDGGLLKVSRGDGFKDDIPWEPMTEEEKAYYRQALHQYRVEEASYENRVQQTYHDLTGM